MRNFLNSILCVSLIVFISCHKEEQLTCCDFEISYEKEYELENKWVFVGFVNRLIDSEECVENEEFTMNIEFVTDSTFRAKSSCNGLQGSYQILSENEIVLKDVIISQVACADDRREELEERYSHDVTYAIHFAIEGNKLILTSISGVELVYRAN